MNWIKRYKSQLIALGWFSLGVLFVFTIGASGSSQANRVCSDIAVTINQSEGNYFVTEEGVKEMLKAKFPDRNLHVPVNAINTQSLEAYLVNTPYIKNAEIYIDINGKMWVEVQQQNPIVRIIDRDNANYYLTSDGLKMPTSKLFSARVPVVTGYLRDNGKNKGKIEGEHLQGIFELVKDINSSKFWLALIEQIYGTQNGDLCLQPKLGNFEILLGTTNNMETKLANFEAFLLQVIDKIDLNQYKLISLKFNNQVVCTKK